jgi:hypothetical protein
MPKTPMPRTDPDKVKLLHGPYKTPRLRRGARVHCLYRDKLVIVTGLSAGRIPWPLCKPPGRAHPGLLVEEELARAVPCESSLAVQYWWGASPRVVWCWRKALGVGRYNEGSLRLYRINGEAAAAVLRGVPLPPEAVERRRRTAVEMNLAQYLQPCPCPNGSRPWTDADSKRHEKAVAQVLEVRRLAALGMTARQIGLKLRENVQYIGMILDGRGGAKVD